MYIGSGNQTTELFTFSTDKSLYAINKGVYVKMIDYFMFANSHIKYNLTYMGFVSPKNLVEFDNIVSFSYWETKA